MLRKLTAIAAALACAASTQAQVTMSAEFVHSGVPSLAVVDVLATVTSGDNWTYGGVFANAINGAALIYATDPNTGVTEQLTVNQLLETTYLPLCKRRSDAPEHYARTLQPAYKNLAGLIETHLDSALGHARHRLAVGAVEQSHTDFKWLVNVARSAGRWDEVVLLTGARAFDFS